MRPSRQRGPHPLNSLIKKIIICSILATFILSCFLTVLSCEPAAASKAITVTDFRGRTLVFDKPASRIVCLIESALSGIYMLGEERRVVGISANVYRQPVFPYYAALDERIAHKKLSAPGNWDFVSIESVIALRPDVVIIWAHQTEVISMLERLGIRVFGVFIKDRADIDREMIELGRLTGSEKRARRLVSYAQNEIQRVTARLRDIPIEQRPGVYYMWAQSNLETSCGGSAVNDLVELAGGRNVCGRLPHEHMTVNLEQIFGWNPDMIVMWNNDRKDPSDIIADEQWRLIKAVRNSRVYELPEVFLCDLWTLKYLYAVKMVAKWTHPERFRDIDLDSEKRKMLKVLYGGRLKGISR
jgi:iron complex transport system substrate-binding protein